MAPGLDNFVDHQMRRLFDSGGELQTKKTKNFKAL